jgi:hypothetical protein
MCGSTLPPDEIDHVIPKNIYPEYSVFSHNLVPACKCNRKKGQVYKGLVPPERVLHPYYDKLMQHRLVYLSFEKGIEKPEIDVVLAAPHDENETLKFHVEKILKKTTLLRYAENAWAKFSDLPRLTLRSFKKVSGPINVFDFREEMEALVEESDYKHGTPNNWQSMFHYGLLHSPLHLDFVHQQLNQGR